MNTRRNSDFRKHLIVITIVIMAFTVLFSLKGQASELAFSTYFGGSGHDVIRDIVLDGHGNVYVAGITNSHNLPTSVVSFQPKYGGGPIDAFVAKVSSDGASLIWCTYLGGSASDYASAIALDQSGNVYVTGMSASRDFPTTPNAYRRNLDKGVEHKNRPRSGDAFISKFSPDGAQLLYSTYLGGSGSDYAMDIVVDPATNSAYVTGGTLSTDFPTTANAYDKTYDRGLFGFLLAKREPDAFVAKLSADGANLLFATYLGGAAYDVGEGIALDKSGFLYVAGPSGSKNFPTTNGVFQRKLRGGTDVWVTKFSPEGTDLIFSTLIGGSGNDAIEHSAIGVDSEGNTYISGFTHSTDFPTTAGAYRKTLSGSIDNFVAKLAADGGSLIFASLFGGSDDWETPFGTQGLDSEGNVLVGGGTSSSDFLVTVDAQQSSSKGNADLFLVKFSKEVSKLLYATYLGGSAKDHVRGLALSPDSRAVYLTGQTFSTDFPTTHGALLTSYQGNGDSFILKLLLSPVVSGGTEGHIAKAPAP